MNMCSQWDRSSIPLGARVSTYKHILDNTHTHTPTGKTNTRKHTRQNETDETKQNKRKTKRKQKKRKSTRKTDKKTSQQQVITASHTTYIYTTVFFQLRLLLT